MATTFQNDTLFESDKYIVKHWQAYGDTDQSAVTAIDTTTLTSAPGYEHGTSHAPSYLSLYEIEWSIQGWEYVQLLFDATTDDEMITMSGDGSMNFRGVGGKPDPQSSGSTGLVKLTSQGAGTDSSYNIVAVFKKYQ